MDTPFFVFIAPGNVAFLLRMHPTPIAPPAPVTTPEAKDVLAINNILWDLLYENDDMMDFFYPGEDEEIPFDQDVL